MNAKAKGNAGERELCEKLSAIFGGSFVRVPNSGAYTGGSNAFRKTSLSQAQIRAFKGDIIPPDHLPKLVVECKFYAAFPWHQMLTCCPMLDGWINQHYEAADQNDIGFICWKVNHRGWTVATPVACDFKFTGSHAIYRSPHGDFHVAEALSFFADNRETILRLAG